MLTEPPILGMRSLAPALARRRVALPSQRKDAEDKGQRFEVLKLGLFFQPLRQHTGNLVGDEICRKANILCLRATGAR